VQDLLRQAQNDTAHHLDGIAISVKNPELMGPIIDDAVAAGIPVVTFDSDASDSNRMAYIGTDNNFMGETLAKVARQLVPEGGTFAILLGDSSPNVEARDRGFRNAIDPELWTELPGSPVNYERDLDTALLQMNEFAEQNPTVIVTTTGGPFFHSAYGNFFKRHRYRNITIISADDFAVQIEYLSRGYVHGLVGQMPYEMGFQAARVLFDLKTNRAPGSSLVLGTNLISHIQVPLVLPELIVDNNLIGNLKVIGNILLVLIWTVALVCGVWTCWNRQEAVVKAAQPIFLILVALGVAILGSTIIPLSMDDDGDQHIADDVSVHMCMLVPWLASCGFAITFSALASKTFRINRVVEGSRECRRVKVTMVDVLVPFSGLLMLNVIVLVLWTVLDPLEYVRIDNAGTDGWNRIISTYGACRCDEPIAYVATLAVINLGVLAVAIWQAYKSRNIRLEFAESKYIAICMVSLLEAFLIGFPILMVVRDSPKAFYLAIIFIVFVICVGVLLLIFVPKMRISAEYSQRPLVEQKRMIRNRIHESVVPGVHKPARDGYSTPVSDPRSSLSKEEAARKAQRLAEEGEESELGGEEDPGSAL
jgi:gamma-aminobutyric acid type B receptor